MAYKFKLFKIFSILSPYSKDSSYLNLNSGIFLTSNTLPKCPRIIPLASSKFSLVESFCSSLPNTVKYTVAIDKSLVKLTLVIVTYFNLSSLALNNRNVPISLSIIFSNLYCLNLIYYPT